MDKFTYMLYIKKLDNIDDKIATDIFDVAINEIAMDEMKEEGLPKPSNILYAFKLLCKASSVLKTIPARFSANYAFTRGLSCLIENCGDEVEILSILEYLPIAKEVVEKPIVIHYTTICSRYTESKDGKQYGYALLPVKDAEKLIDVDVDDIIQMGYYTYVIIKFAVPDRSIDDG